jgi:hypothetical protein
VRILLKEMKNRFTMSRTATAIALSELKTKLANAYLDLRFGKLLRGMKSTRYTHLGAYATANSSYAVVRSLFRGRVKPSDVLVDVGCGKGRVINAWLLEGYSNRMIGVELDADIARDTRARLQRYPNVCITTGDVVANFPDNGTLFYLYNPFDSHAMAKFKDRLQESLRHRACDEATIMYSNCQHVAVFADDPACEIEWGKREHPFAIIHLHDSQRKEH